MEDTQQIIDDSVLDSEEEEEEEEDERKRGEPLAKLRVFKNQHIPETELPLYLGDNVLGRDPNTCSLPLVARSVSKQHTVISISVFQGNGRCDKFAMEALVWDLGSMNGTRKGRFKLTPHVRYALSEEDSLVIADIPCQYTSYPDKKMADQGNKRSPGKRTSGRGGQGGNVKAGMPFRESIQSRGPGRETSADEEIHINKEVTKTPAVGTSPRQKTPAQTKPLSLEKTPTQPERTLVPESDSDSDGEQERRKDRRERLMVSDSDSHISSPPGSTFLSPSNQVIPESPITPSSTAINKPSKIVSFSEEEKDTDVVRPQRTKKRAQVIVDDSEEEEEEETGREDKRERERVSPGGLETGKTTRREQEVSVEQPLNVSGCSEDGVPACASAVSPDTRPELNMDSDTDVEGEKEMVPSGPTGTEAPSTWSIGGPQPAHPHTGSEQFHMDSDTDVEEDNAVVHVSRSTPPSDVPRSPTDRVPVIKPIDFHPDSDTDVEEDDLTSVSVSKATSITGQAVTPADPPSSDQPIEFHLDSDTDVEDGEDMNSRTGGTSTGTAEAHSRTPPNSSCVEVTVSSPAAALELHSDSETDEEENPFAPALRKPTDVSPETKPITTIGPGAALDILSDSDTDMEVSVPSSPSSSSSPSPPPAALATTLKSDTDMDTDATEGLEPKPTLKTPAEVVPDPSDLRMDSDTEAEEEETGVEEAEEVVIQAMSGEGAAGTPRGFSPPQQKCSTPLALKGSVVEEMEAQALVSPPDPFRRPLPPALRPTASSDSQEDEDFVVAETQSFVFDGRDNRRTLSEDPTLDPTLDPTQPNSLEQSSREEKEDQAGGEASFQLGLSDSSNLQAQNQNLSQSTLDLDVELAATQAYGTIPAQRGTLPEVDADLEATQAYGTIPAQRGTLPEVDADLEATQAYGGGSMESALGSGLSRSRRQVDFALGSTQAYIPPPCSDTEDEEEEETEMKNVATAETLPMADYEEVDDDDNDDEKIQPLELPLMTKVATAETLLASTYEEEEEEEDEDLLEPKPSIPVRRGRPRGQKTNVVETQPVEVLTQQYLSTAETLPMSVAEENDGDEDEIIVGPPKRRGRSRQLEEEGETQLVTAETLPLSAAEESDDDKAVVGPPKKRRRPRQLEDKEETQTVTAETQPMSTHETDDETEDEKEKTIRTTEQNVRGKPRKTTEAKAGTSGINRRSKRGRGAKAGEEGQKLGEESSEPQTRQTRGKGKAVTPSKGRGRRGKVVPQEEEECEEEGVELVRPRRGRKSKKQLKEESEEVERLEREQREKKDEAEKDRLLKEKEEAESAERTLKEQEEKERMEQQNRLQETRDRLEAERKETEEKERMEREKGELEEKVRLEREEQGRLEREMADREKRERDENERVERIQKDKEEQKRLKEEREERERLEQERMEREEEEKKEKIRKEKEEQERLVSEAKERLKREREEREEMERLEKMRKDKEEQERVAQERAKNEEKERLEREEKERVKKEKDEREEKDRLEKILKDKEQERVAQERAKNEEKERLEREEKERVKKEKDEREEKDRLEKILKDKEEQERVAQERAKNEEKERLEREEKERVKKEKDEREEKDRLEKILKDKEEQERVAQERAKNEEKERLEREEKERVKKEKDEREEKDRLEKILKEKEEQERLKLERLETEKMERELAKKERLEKEQKGRRRTLATTAPSAALEAQMQDSFAKKCSPRRSRSRSNSSNSISSEISTCSVSSQSQGRGRGGVRGRGRGRGRRTESTTEPVSVSHPPIGSQGEQVSSPKATAKGRRGRKSENLLEVTAASQPDCEKADAHEPSATRGRRRAKDNNLAPAGGSAEEGQLSLIGEGGRDDLQSRGRGHKAVTPESTPTQVTQTPTGKTSRKRVAPVDSPPVAKILRSLSPSPVSTLAHPGSGRETSQTFKVLFTGVVDEEGERVVSRLGGSMARGVADMTHLVTDKVRRTVKFLCAVARGVPVVTTDWLNKCGKAGSFLPPNCFLVKDAEQEKKFCFHLQDSLRAASNQPLLQGYEIHVTKSVKPDPAQMKEIISCSGARFLPKMPSAHKPQTVVVSCEEDWVLCAPALAASLPVLSAEFLLTGILQQKVDLQSHALLSPTGRNSPQVGGRGRGRKRT